NAVGEKCAAFLDHTVHDVKTDALQIDEIWCRVGITQRRTVKDDELRGDFYTYLAVTDREKFIVSCHTGKRNYENTDKFVSDVAKRIVGRIQVTTDSYRPYQSIVKRHLLERLDFATMQKIYSTPYSPTLEPWRRYSPPQCTGVKIRIQAGTPRREKINTSFVERANLSVRHFNRRFTRLSLGWSRKLENHRNATSLFVAAYNFCKVHSTLRCTPAV